MPVSSGRNLWLLGNLAVRYAMHVHMRGSSIEYHPYRPLSSEARRDLAKVRHSGH